MRVGFVLQAAFASSAKTLRYAISAHSLHSSSDATMALGETMQVKKLSENAVMPVRGSEHAAGFDLARCVCFVDMLFQNFKKLNVGVQKPCRLKQHNTAVCTLSARTPASRR